MQLNPSGIFTYQSQYWANLLFEDSETDIS